MRETRWETMGILHPHEREAVRETRWETMGILHPHERGGEGDTVGDTVRETRWETMGILHPQETGWGAHRMTLVLSLNRGW